MTSTHALTLRRAFGGRADGNAATTVGDGSGRGLDAVLRRIGADRGDAVAMRQVHSARVAVVGADERGTTFPDVDGLVTGDVGVALVVLTADCVPLLLAGGGAVAAVHAGREGVAADITARAVATLVEVGRTTPDAVTAWLGPAIGGCCYEVPADLAARVAARVPATAATTTWGTPSLDLPAGVVAQLRAAGVQQVHREGACTRCGGGTVPPGGASPWFSHRAASAPDGPPAGRNAAAIMLEGAAR